MPEGGRFVTAGSVSASVENVCDGAAHDVPALFTAFAVKQYVVLPDNPATVCANEPLCTPSATLCAQAPMLVMPSAGP